MTARPSRLRSSSRRLRRLAIGEAGWGPALVVACVAVVVAFISIAGARLLVSADNTATRQALGQMPVIDAGAVVSANPQAAAVNGPLSAADIDRIKKLLAADLPLRGDFLLGQSWGGVLLPAVTVTNPAPSAVTIEAPKMEVA